MDEPNIRPRALKPDDFATIRDDPHHESGVLASSILYLHLPSHFARNSLFYAPHIGKYFCNENYFIQRKRFDYYLCLLVESGTLFVSANGEDCTVEPQNILLLNCKESHKYYAKGKLSFRFFHFDGASSAALYDHLVSLHGNVVKEYRRPIIEDAFNAILALAYDGYQNEFKISAQIHLILCELLSPEVSFENHRSQAVARSISFMENHFLQDLSVKEIAASAYYSEYHFSRLFRKQTGISPHEYLQNLRIAFAQHLLATTDMPVGLVGEKCGFNSAQHFIRGFKKQSGCTPNGYRKKTVIDKLKKN